MAPDDKRVIELFAAGQHALREAAIDAYRHDIKERGIDHACIHQRFMSEIDNPVPDLGLRSRYRIDILRACKLFSPTPEESRG